MNMMPFEKPFWSPFIQRPNFFHSRFSKKEPLKVNLYESPEQYLILVETGDLSKEDLDISLTGSFLEIQVKKEVESNKENQRRKIGKKIRLEHPISQDTVGAEFKDGILKITIQKLEMEPSRSINIA